MSLLLCFFFFNDTATTEIYTLSLHDALPISATGTGSPPSRPRKACRGSTPSPSRRRTSSMDRSEEHTSELQSRQYLVCRLLLEKKKKQIQSYSPYKTTQHMYIRQLQ